MAKLFLKLVQVATILFQNNFNDLWDFYSLLDNCGFICLILYSTIPSD